MFIKTLFAALSLGVMSTSITLAKDNAALIAASPGAAASIILQDSIPVQSPRGDSVANVPFGQAPAWQSPNDITVINPSAYLTYDNVTEVAQMLSGRVPGLTGLSVRGLGDALVVIDGIPRPISSVTIQEIEQITILKDVNSAILYGTQANNGVILITTKRGRPNDKRITALFETGMSEPVAFPKYLGSAEYMELYNEARVNDGLAPLYDAETIDGTRSGVNPTRYPDVDYYTPDFLKTSKPYSRFVADFSGGNDNAQYYLNLGWERTGSLMNKGGENLHDDRLNIRSNIDFDVNPFIKANLDVAGIFNLGNSPTGDFFGDASSLRPNLFPGLIDQSLITDETILQTASLVEGQYVVGGTSLYRTNPYGYLNLGGFNKSMGVAVQFTNGLTFDLRSITKGLSLKTNVSFDFANRYNEVQTNTYAVYQTDYEDDGTLLLERIGADRFSGAMEVQGSNLNRKVGLSGLLDYARVFNNDHAVSATVLAYADKYNDSGEYQADKHTHLGSRVNYVYGGKYIVNFSSALSSSAKLAPGNRVAFSPSVGLGWVMSEESFFGKSTFNFLKLSASAGIIHTDVNLTRPFAYENIYSEGRNVNWNDGEGQRPATVLSNVGNPNLFYEKRKEVNVGVEAVLFNRSVSLSLNAFREIQSDLFSVPYNNYPAHLGGLVATENFGENRSSGIELGLSWRKSIHPNFSFAITPTMLLRNSEVVKRAEYWNEDYLYRTGNSTSAIYGLEAIGFFSDADDIASHAFQEFGEVQPGDIKYKDQNSDGVVDADDEIMIGEGASTLIAGLNLKLKFRNFTFFTLLTARDGSDRSYSNSYYWVYGDRKYSEVVRGRWTPGTAATATYPRLTSLSSSNNFRTSTFWLYDNSLVSLNRMQLSYDLPLKFASKLHTKNLGIYIRAYNVANFSKNRDKVELNIGSEPQYRSYMVGVKALF